MAHQHEIFVQNTATELYPHFQTYSARCERRMQLSGFAFIVTSMDRSAIDAAIGKARSDRSSFRTRCVTPYLPPLARCFPFQPLKWLGSACTEWPWRFLTETHLHTPSTFWCRKTQPIWTCLKRCFVHCLENFLHCEIP
jgi:hypothetical protein